MTRAINNVASRARRKKILEHAKGFYGGLSKQYRQAVERVHRAWVFAFRDRKVRKRMFRALWIARINAAARMYGTTYSVLMNRLKAKNVGLDRKVLADIAYHEPETFKRIVEAVR
jgi:large subunit ribosomal protein L20